MTKTEKYNRLIDLINQANEYTYQYELGTPVITDQEWDNLYFDIKKLEEELDIYPSNSPTQSIYEVVSALQKVEHNHKMLSLQKTKDLSEVEEFIGEYPVLAMMKMDGLTCSLTYQDGKLISAETRGNGLVGEDILHNVLHLNSIPKNLSELRGRLIVDGEVICTLPDFEMFASDYKNPRNFAAGSIRLLDSRECKKRKLTFVAWDVIEGFETETTVNNKLTKLDMLGFTTVPRCLLPAIDANGNRVPLDIIVDHLQESAKNLFPIDGVVFKFDNIEYGKSLGETSHHFKNAIAYKFYDETYSTELLNIEWTMGRTGILTPVAVFKPVDIDGSTVERANLHNLSILRSTLHGRGWKGQKIEVFKANMIIPQIASAEEDDEKTKYYFMKPFLCPVCNNPTSVKQENDSEFLFCDNPNCEGKLINQLDHFCGKKGLDIKGLSKATLEKLIDWGWISSFKDLFEVKNYRAEWIKKPGFGVKSVDKVLNAIEDSKNCELANFIASLGIPLIGTTASKEIVKVFSDWDSFMSAVESGYHFWDIQNFGYEMHSAITKFDYTEAKELYNNYLAVNSAQPQSDKIENNLDGLNFVITGKVVHFKNRDELKSVIEAHGGKVVGSISSKTNYLINNDVESTSSKNVSAKKLGVPIISEDAFLEMFSLS